jgi:glycerol kinase
LEIVMKYILALDQGTTSSRAILFDSSSRIVASSQQEFKQILPMPGHVEHDPEDIWQSQITVARQAIQKAGADIKDVAAIGITNQRETTIIWDKQTGRPVDNAIVWQSRISADICEHLKRYALPISSEKLNAGDLSVGDMLLNRCADEGIDLLVMGAFAQSRRGHQTLGEVGCYLLDSMTVPVLMSH